MSKPTGTCVFCHQRGNLTKGHIWPKWIGEVMPFDDAHHVQLVGQIETFKPNMRVPGFRRIVKQGHGTTRKPRNTCGDCNSGWMSKIESAAKLGAAQLMKGETVILDRVQQMLIATLLCLITVRNEFSHLAARGISEDERTWLRTTLTPPWNWQIWVARYQGIRSNEHWVRHFPMHIASAPTGETGPDKCNTQTTTLVVGQLSAHLFSSTDFLDFPGYAGIHLCKIWPPSDWFIDWRHVPAYSEQTLNILAESLARDLPTGHTIT